MQLRSRLVKSEANGNKIALPIYWDQTKKKKVLVSMNAYRNWHHFTSNKFKQEFHGMVYDQIESVNLLPFTGAFKLYIGLWYKNSNCDGSNVSALIEKVVLDAFQSHKIIEQDSVKYHLGTTWEILGCDREEPRAEIRIVEVKP